MLYLEIVKSFTKITNITINNSTNIVFVEGFRDSVKEQEFIEFKHNKVAKAFYSKVKNFLNV